MSGIASAFKMSEEDKEYYHNDANLEQSVRIVGSAFREMPTVGEAFASAGRGTTEWASGLGGRVSNYVKKVRHPYDDNVVVPADMRTLLGEDISTLFEGAEEQFVDTANGSGMTELVSTGSYGTEMLSANLSSGSRRSLATFPADKRAAFEIVLLSKKYANMYVEGDQAANDATAQAYADMMARYRQACEAQNVDWNEVMNYACWEMQTQSVQYRDDSNSLYEPEVAEANRVLVNRAHGMLAECGDEGWEETMLPHIQSRIERGETYDTQEQDRNWFDQIRNWITEKLKAWKEALGSPWAAIKDMSGSVIGAMDTYATYDKLIGAEHRAQSQQDVERAIETIHGTVDKVKEVAGPVVDVAGGYVSDRYEQAKERLGLVDEGTTPEDPEAVSPEGP